MQINTFASVHNLTSSMYQVEHCQSCWMYHGLYYDWYSCPFFEM